MKPKNFPARKLMRQLAAEQGIRVGQVPQLARHVDHVRKQIDDARAVRTKKRRSA